MSGDSPHISFECFAEDPRCGNSHICARALIGFVCSCAAFVILQRGLATGSLWGATAVHQSSVSASTQRHLSNPSGGLQSTIQSRRLPSGTPLRALSQIRQGEANVAARDRSRYYMFGLTTAFVVGIAVHVATQLTSKYQTPLDPLLLAEDSGDAIAIWPTTSETDQVREQLIAAGLCSTVSGSGSVLSTDKGQIFVKVGTGGSSASKAILEYEFEGLSRMAKAAPSLSIPKPWLVGTLRSGGAFIVMDYIKQGGGRSDLQRRLGLGLAEMHLAAADHPTFGFPVDGCCGACRQLNNVDQEPLNWVEFWRKYRLGDQLALLRQRNPGDHEIQDKGALLMEKLPAFFSMIDVEAIKPSLLHGDLWSGNYSSDSNGNPSIFDPACYYGHHEADLGIARMFGGFSPAFWDAYHEVIPRAPGYEKRALLYELHHHLNHYNIFGSSYRSGALRLMERLLSDR